MTTTTQPEPTVPVSSAEGFTVEDWMALSEDDRRVELVDGSYHVSPPAVRRHHRIQNRLERQLMSQLPPDLSLEDSGGGIAPAELDSHHALIPDVVVLRSGLAIRDDVIDPTEVVLAVEVVSPSSRRRDHRDKRELYAEWGIGAYWIVELDPAVTITALRLVDGAYVDDHGPQDDVLEVTEPFAARVDVRSLGA